MQLDSGLITIIITIITTLGGAKAWEFYAKKLELKREDEKEERQNNYMYRDDLRERVAVLEQKLSDSQKDKEALLKSMSDLQISLAEFKTRIEFLETALKEKEKVIEELKQENRILKGHS